MLLTRTFALLNATAVPASRLHSLAAAVPPAILAAETRAHNKQLHQDLTRQARAQELIARHQWAPDTDAIRTALVAQYKAGSSAEIVLAVAKMRDAKRLASQADMHELRTWSLATVLLGVQSYGLSQVGRFVHSETMIAHVADVASWLIGILGAAFAVQVTVGAAFATWRRIKQDKELSPTKYNEVIAFYDALDGGEAAPANVSEAAERERSAIKSASF